MRHGIIERALTAVAARLDVEVGQLYTVVAGIVAALVLGVVGLPPVLDSGGTPVAAASSDRGAPTSPTTVPAPGAPIPAPTDTGPRPGPAAAPPTTVSFRPTPPPARGAAPTTTTTSTSAPAPRLPIPANPEGTTTVFARVPTPGAPEGIGIGPDGTVFVATNNAAGRGGVGPSEIIVFAPDGVTAGSFPIPGQPEDRTNGLTGLAVDRRGRVLVADAATGRLLRLDPSRGELSELVTVPDVGLCLVTIDGPCEPGPLDGAPELRGITIAPSGAVLVADRGQGLVWRYDGTELTVAATIDTRLPGGGPTDVALRGDEVVVTVDAASDSVPPGQSAVLVFRDGAATALVRYDAAEALAGVAVGASGRIYVTLAGSDAVDVVTDEGVARRFDGGNVSPGFDAPTGLTVDDGRLLVTSQSTVSDDPDHWVVHAIVNRDAPTTAT